MVGPLSLTIAITLMSFVYADGGSLWCYSCNTDLRVAHTTECNDPYNPSPNFDLVLCPQNDSHHCLKSVITYRDVLVTVRGCVPSREIDGYCQHEEYFPKSSITCSFCNNYACNGQGSYHLSVAQHLELLLLFVSVSSYLK
ncbi:uncharacterized protein LOC143149573 [Ptiloglossa arizonensis]|uniref:uncharacterized protein LOC143149573 n=1 Tax=Ptiloglossa arizonensis TaxID=3350558 RepID=UPI003F9F69E0